MQILFHRITEFVGVVRYLHYHPLLLGTRSFVIFSHPVGSVEVSWRTQGHVCLPGLGWCILKAQSIDKQLWNGPAS